MPTPVGNVESFVQKLRFAVGNPDEQELASDALRAHLDRALGEVNTDRPLVLLGSFPTVAGQSSYDVVPAAAYEIVDVFYYPGVSGTVGDPFRAFQLTELFGYDVLAGGVAAGARLFDNPALAVGFYKKVESYRHIFSGRMEREIDDGTIWLAPAPCDVSTVFFTYSAPRFAALDEVTRPYDRYVLLRAEVFALESMANQRSHMEGGNVGNQSFRSGGGRVQAELARQKLEQYRAEVRLLPTGTFVG